MSVFNVINSLAKTTPRFTEEKLEEIIKWFDENARPGVTTDGDPVNVVTIEQLITFLDLKKFHRRSFHYPSYLEIMKEAENIDAGVMRLLTKEQFIYVLNKWVVGPSIKHELLLAFKVFDTENRNHLDLDDIKIIVTGYGEPFTDLEIREISRDANVCGDGNIAYEDFIESMFSTAPELYEIKTEYLYDDPDEDPSVPPEPESIVTVVKKGSPPVKAPSLTPPPLSPRNKKIRKGKKKK